MPDATRLALAKHRLDKARECYNDAATALNAEAYSNSANRSYYSIFHAMRAILALDEFDSKKHSGIIAAFRQRYIKTGIFPTQFSEIIELAFKIRGKSDYDDFYVVSKEDVVEQMENADVFIKELSRYIEEL